MGWLEKFFPPDSGKKKGLNLPSLDVRDVRLPANFLGGSVPDGGEIPNASLVYGIGAAILAAFSLYSLFTGAWFTALLLLLPAGALFGFALHYLRHPS